MSLCPSFYCRKCRISHPDECPPAVETRVTVAKTTVDWSAHLPKAELPPTDTSVPWPVGVVVAACTPGGTSTALVFRVLSDEVNQYYEVEVLASAMGKPPGYKMKIGRRSFYGEHSKIVG